MLETEKTHWSGKNLTKEKHSYYKASITPESDRQLWFGPSGSSRKPAGDSWNYSLLHTGSSRNTNESSLFTLTQPLPLPHLAALEVPLTVNKLSQQQGQQHQTLQRQLRNGNPGFPSNHPEADTHLLLCKDFLVYQAHWCFHSFIHT